MLDTRRRADYHACEQLEFPFTEEITMAPDSASPGTPKTVEIRLATPKVVGQLEHIQRQLIQISDRYSGAWVKQVMELQKLPAGLLPAQTEFWKGVILNLPMTRSPASARVNSMRRISA